jgi:hypothetical protein
MFTKEDLGQLTDEELDTLVTQVREVKRERVAQAKAVKRKERKRIAEENLQHLSEMNEGDDVSFIYKGEETTAPFVKTTDKRFIVEIDGNKRTIMPDKFVS